MTTGDVLAAIDGAISDWEVSPDAMRWTPDPAEPAALPFSSEPIMDAGPYFRFYLPSGQGTLYVSLSGGVGEAYVVQRDEEGGTR